MTFLSSSSLSLSPYLGRKRSAARSISISISQQSGSMCLCLYWALPGYLHISGERKALLGASGDNLLYLHLAFLCLYISAERKRHTEQQVTFLSSPIAWREFFYNGAERKALLGASGDIYIFIKPFSISISQQKGSAARSIR